MISTDAVDISREQLFALQTSNVLNITGNIYKYQRPLNSPLEDIVINSLPMSNDQLQECIVNWNIHVPNLRLDFGGKSDNSQPDTIRLKQLTKAIKDHLSEFWGDDAEYQFNIQQENLIRDDDGTWYMNIRVEFRNVNL